MPGASAMDRQDLPVSVGTDDFSDTTAFLANLRMSVCAQQQALAELVPAFVRQTHKPTSALDKQHKGHLKRHLKIKVAQIVHVLYIYQRKIRFWVYYSTNLLGTNLLG